MRYVITDTGPPNASYHRENVNPIPKLRFYLSNNLPPPPHYNVGKDHQYLHFQTCNGGAGGGDFPMLQRAGKKWAVALPINKN